MSFILGAQTLGHKNRISALLRCSCEIACVTDIVKALKITGTLNFLSFFLSFLSLSLRNLFVHRDEEWIRTKAKREGASPRAFTVYRDNKV